MRRGDRHVPPAARAHTALSVEAVGGAAGATEPLEAAAAQEVLVRHGVWLRPFGKLLYTMPPFVIAEDELRAITTAMREVVRSVE